jgi:hypothetical protein
VRTRLCGCFQSGARLELWTLSVALCQAQDEIDRYTLSETLDDTQRLISLVRRGTIPQQLAAASRLPTLFIDGVETVPLDAVMEMASVRGVPPDALRDCAILCDWAHVAGRVR